MVPPSHIAKPSRINRESFTQHEFHAEVCDTGQGRMRLALLKPGRRFLGVPLRLDEVIDLPTEAGIG